MESSGNYSVRVLERAEDLEGVRGYWEAMQWHPYADIDYYILSARIEPGFEQPFVVAVLKDEFPKALFIGRVIQKTLQWKIGYKKLGESNVRCLEIVYGGILGELSEIAIHSLLEILLQYLNRGKADLVHFNHLNVESPLYTAARKQPGIFCRDVITTYNPHIKFHLPESFDLILKNASGNLRHNIRKWRNRVEKGFANENIVRCYTQVKDVDCALEDVNRIALETYQHRMGVGFQYTEDTRRKWQLLAERGVLRAYILYLRNEPCAFWTVYSYGNLCFTIETGYDPQYKYYHPGMNLLVDIIEELCIDPKCDAIDYGFGDAHYKQLFGNERWLEASVNIYAPTVKGQWIRFLSILTKGSTSAARKLLLRMKVFDRVKRLWRNRLSSGK